jgi:hypothetical protein
MSCTNLERRVYTLYVCTSMYSLAFYRHRLLGYTCKIEFLSQFHTSLITPWGKSLFVNTGVNHMVENSVFCGKGNFMSVVRKVSRWRFSEPRRIQSNILTQFFSIIFPL